MKKLLTLVLAAALLCPVTALAKKNDEGLVPAYQVQGAGSTTSNSTQVEVTIITKKKDKVTEDDLCKAAVHAVLFRSYDDTSSGDKTHHKSIMDSPTAESEYIDFFEPFFKNGDYRKYVQIVDNSRRVVKSGKEWKVSSIVRVNSTQLTKDLQKQGMAKTLGTGW